MRHSFCYFKKESNQKCKVISQTIPGTRECLRTEMQGRITKEFVMRPYVFTTQLRRIIIMKKRLIAVLMCAVMITVLGAGCGSKKKIQRKPLIQRKNIQKTS